MKYGTIKEMTKLVNPNLILNSDSKKNFFFTHFFKCVPVSFNLFKNLFETRETMN